MRVGESGVGALGLAEEDAAAKDVGIWQPSGE